jgi:hypothetical protein
VSRLDRAIKLIWQIGVVGIMVLLYAAKQSPLAFPIGFTLGWVLMVMLFSRRRVFFPDVNNYSPEMQDAVTFFGWFVLMMLGAGAVALWLFGGTR